MNEQTLIDSLASACEGQLPNRADVLALRPFTQDEVRARANRFISLIHEGEACSRDHANFVTRDDRTLVQLAGGARAVLYHASGALQFSAGIAPFQAPFERVEEREVLVRLVTAAAQRLQLRDWAGEDGGLAFERLFQSKGQGADRNEGASEPVLFRVTGAWRHSIGGIPVLGAASAAITLAGDGTLDALAVRIRPGVAEKLDSAVIVAPELAARQIAARLASVLGQAKERLPGDAIVSQTMRFGYLDLGKRKAQRVLAPVFVAQIALRHRLETQGYVFAVPATEQHYLDLPLYGTEAIAPRSRASTGSHCPPVLR
ncbi:MAG TPA: hypothetical protein VGD30_02185 [Telluria sp.]